MPSTYEQRKRWKLKHRNLHLAGKARNNYRRVERHQKFISDYKANHPCICGEADPVALDCHHTSPKTKNNTLSQMAKCGLEKIKAELKQCVIMCSNCHRKGHAGRPRPEHISYFELL